MLVVHIACGGVEADLQGQAVAVHAAEGIEPAPVEQHPVGQQCGRKDGGAGRTTYLGRDTTQHNMSRKRKERCEAPLSVLPVPASASVVEAK